MDMVNEGYRGWVIYADADAYVADLNFPIHEFLSQRAERAILAAPGGVPLWNVNAGILLFNFGLESGRALIEQWYQKFTSEVDIDRLKRAVTPWHEGIVDDQALLHGTLRGADNLEVILERLPFTVLGNDDSAFLRQLLRSRGSLADRVQAARKQIDLILPPPDDAGPPDGPSTIAATVRARGFCAATANEFPLAEMNLTQLANKYVLERGTRWGAKHNYSGLYDLAFRHIRRQPIVLLELGLGADGPEVGGSIGQRTHSPSATCGWSTFPPQGSSVSTYAISPVSSTNAFLLSRATAAVWTTSIG
jgi:hypothetical protein